MAVHTMRRAVYRPYQIWLLRQPRRRPMPGQIGIILDGNRRHGRRHGISEPGDIYSLGAGKLDDVLTWCAESAIPAVTLWVLPKDNLRRSAAGVSGILAAAEAKLRLLAKDPRIRQRSVRVNAIGRLELLPSSTIAALEEARHAGTER